MELVRSFIAIEIPSETRAELATLEEKLKARRHPFVKWVAPQSVHLTLKFLGSVPADTISQIAESAAQVAKPLSPFCLQIGGTGAFPGWQRPQVIWVGIGGDLPRLAALQKELEAALSSLGFPPESRAFSPHLTIGRLKDRASPEDRRRFGQWAQSIELEVSPSFEVHALGLMKSQLTPDGPIYSKLATLEFKGLG